MLKNQFYKKILSIVLSLSIICFPIQQAQAIVFLPGVAVLAEYLGASGSLATAIDASAALHLAVISIGWNSANDASPVATDMPLTVRLNPNSPLAVPAGWTAGVGGAQPVPPSSASAGTETHWSASAPSADSDMNLHGSSASSNCSNYWTTACGGNFSSGSCAGLTYSVFTVSSIHSECRAVSPTYPSYQGNGVISYDSFLYQSGCPAGYSVEGSSCVLSNPAIVPKPADGKCGVIGNGSAPVPDSRDPDCAGLAAAYAGNTTTTLSDGTTVAHGSDGTLNITRSDGTWATLNTNSNLETTVIEHYPNASTGMTTNYQTNLSAPDPTTGVVTITGSASGTSQGIGSAAGSSTAGAYSSPVTFDKTGLATSAGQAETNNKLTGIASQLDDTGAPTGLPVAAADSVGTATTDMASAKTSLIGIATGADPVPLDSNFFESPFPSSSGCTPWSMTWSDVLTGSHTLTLDLCPQQDVIQRISGWVLYILTIATIFSMFITT